MNNKKNKNLKTLIDKSKRILIIGHINPDLDSVATVLALYRGLKKIKRNVQVWSQTKTPENSLFLKDIHEIKTPPYPKNDYDLAITVDTPVVERLGEEVLPYLDRAQKIINIDHHISNTNYGDVNIVDAQASACGEIVYSLLKSLNVEIDPVIAEYIYISILTDTGGFRFSNTTEKSHLIAAEMLRLGVEPEKIYRNVYENRSLSKVKLWKIALKSMKILFDGQVCALSLKAKDYKSAGAKKEDTDGFIEYARSIKGVKIAVFFEQLQDQKTVKIGFRSNDKEYDMNQLAKIFAGGGHKGASGARIQGSMENVQKRVYQEIRKIV